MCAYSTFMKRLNKICKQEGSATNELMLRVLGVLDVLDQLRVIRAV